MVSVARTAGNAAGTTPARPARLPFLPGLDGLRALAVIAVVLYHTGWLAVPGGFLGVDVFFVLSGFLITTLLVEEHRTSGRLDLAAFFVRRARRLLPALWTMLLAVVATAALVVTDELTELRRDVPAALLYVSNWSDLLGHQSYFDSVGRPPLLAHLWSLAIEGQFYVLWPLVLAFVLARGRRPHLARLALVGAGLSTAAMAVVAARGGYPIPNDPSPVYLSTATHAMGLLLGSALGAAWAPWRSSGRVGAPARAPWGLELLGVASLAGLLIAFTAVDELSTGLYRGGFAAVSALAVALVATLAHPGSRLGRVLGAQPLRYLGQRSYGIYLWHWPIFMLTRPGFELALDGVLGAAVRIGLTLAVAEACYRWIERPVRRGALSRWAASHRPISARLIAGPVALLVLVATLTSMLVAPPGQARVLGRPHSVVLRTHGFDRALVPVSSVASDQGGECTRPGAGLRAPSVQLAGVRAAARPAPGPAPAVPPVLPTAEGAPPEAAGSPGAAAATVLASPPPTTVVGDSVLAAMAPALAAHFPLVEIDAVTSRQPAGVLAALGAIGAAGRLGQVVVMGAGTNGAIAERQLRAMLELTAGARLVIVLNDHVDRAWAARNNALIAAVVPEYPNAVVFDWDAIASAHPEWLWADRIHPRPAGADAVVTMLRDEAVRVAP